MTSKNKSSLIDRLVERLPEMHIWGYRYCGPNTDLVNRLAHAEPGINQLDSACKEHDIAYAESSEREFRCHADKLLALRAFGRVYARDSRIGERFAALIVSGLISIKIIFVKIEICFNKVRNCFVSTSKRKSK